MAGQRKKKTPKPKPLDPVYILQKNNYTKGKKVLFWESHWQPRTGIIIGFTDDTHVVAKIVAIKTKELFHRSLNHLDYAEKSITKYQAEGRIKDGKLQPSTR